MQTILNAAHKEFKANYNGAMGFAQWLEVAKQAGKFWGA